MKYSEFILLVSLQVTSYNPYICHAIKNALKKHPEQEEHAAKLHKFIKSKLDQEYKIRVAIKVELERKYVNALYEIFLKKHGNDFNEMDARIQMLTALSAYHRARGN